MLYNMKDLLRTAMKYNFAVPAFNVSDYSMMKGLLELAEDLNAPVIFEIHPDELKHASIWIMGQISAKSCRQSEQDLHLS